MTFCLNDETKVNSYNFRVKNAGLDIARFEENPVMLAQHFNSVWMVIGKWINIRFEGTKLLADAEFDEEDEDAKKIAGKVKRGYVKACSLGLLFDRNNMILAADNVFDLIKSEVMEGSIVAVGSNANAVRLFAAPGELIPEDEIRLSMSQIATQFNKDDNKQTQKMEKFILSAAAIVALASMGVQNTEDSATVSAAIEKLHLNLNAEKATHDATKIALATMTGVQVKRDVAAAILAGKITADLEATYVELGAANYDLFSKTLAALPAKTELGAIINNSAASPTDPKTIDEFEKLSIEKQLAFKAGKPEAYTALFA